jgi:hypothetical protein
MAQNANAGGGSRLPRGAWVLLAWTISVAPCTGAESSLWVSPAILDLVMRPGQTAVQEFQLGNDTSARVKIRAYAWDWWITETNDKAFGPPGSSPLRSMAGWVSFDPAEVTVEPDSVASIKLFLSVPKDASAGYYSVAFFEGASPELPPPAAGQPRLSIVSRLGVLTMVAIEGTEHYQVEVERSEVTPPTEGSELKYSLTLKNRSNVHLMVQGVLAIFTPDHRLVGKTRLQPQRFLPGQSDVIKIPYAGALRPGQYTAVATLIYGRDQSLVEEKSFTVQ